MPQKILIIKPSSLGDVATALPMLCDLRRALPDATIHWLVAPAFAALVTGHDALNDVIIFDRKKLAKWYYSPTAFKEFKKLLRRLKSAQYDLVIDAQGLLRSGFFSKITKAKMRIGFADAREGGSLFYTHKIPIRRREAMSVVRMRALLEPLNIPHDAPPEYRVPINPQADAKVAPLIPENAIGFIPGCRGEGKRWPAEGFTHVISELTKTNPIILFGSPDERELCEQIISSVQAGPRTPNPEPRILNLAGQTSVAEMIAALHRCKLIISNDTGPLHVAVALNKTILGLYGKTDPASVGPYGQLQNVIRFTPNTDWHNTAQKILTRVPTLLQQQEPSCQK